MPEGEYNKILEPDKDYIRVKKDFSNLDEALEKFQDNDFRNTIVNHAYEKILSNHTYTKRVEQIIDKLI